MAGVEPAADPDQAENEHLLEQEGNQYAPEVVLRDKSLNEYVDECDRYLDEKEEREQT